ADSCLCGSYFAGGGGGAIAIESTDIASVVSATSARGGFSGHDGYYAGAGSIYVKGAKSVYGDLTVYNGRVNGNPTELPSLGSGTAQTDSSGALLVTSTNVPPYFQGNWVEIKSAAGVVKNTWRILSIDPTNTKKLTLQPNGTETINVQPGDTFQGVYRFDNIYAASQGVLQSGDPIRFGDGSTNTAVITGPSSGSFEIRPTITSTQPVSVGGVIGVPGFATGSLRVLSGGTLYGGSSVAPLNITATGSVTVDSGGAITVDGLGYGQNGTYPGLSVTVPGGGSHIGLGVSENSKTSPSGPTFGSVYRPQEPGGGGDAVNAKGGGVLRIVAPTVVVNGGVRAHGGGGRRHGGGGGWVCVASPKIRRP